MQTSTASTTISERPATQGVTDPTPAILTKKDRCDTGECPAQAYVRATLPGTTSAHPLELDFCAHHYVEHTAGLASAGARIHDERHRINSKPSPSANV